MFNVSKMVYEHTKGAFDPTVAPLVNAWGFGFENAESVDSATIDTILISIGMDKLGLKSGNNRNVLKSGYGKMQLDFNAVAQGYSVDQIAMLLLQKGNTCVLLAKQ